ncbi:MAG: CPBP family intramembrane metalloprotease [Planctomycetaceae bacterium]|nr:CPBP family intramembrane metalloprotease [Planctomycetaceae bacterium]
MRQPDARDAAWVLACALLAMTGSMLLLRAGLPPFLAGIVQQAAFFGTPLLYARRAGLDPFASNGFLPLRLRQAALVLLASLGSLWLMYGLSKVQTEAFRVAGYEKRAQAEEEKISRDIESARNEGVMPALSLLVLIPPLCEETFFRGLLFRGLASRFGLGIALAGTSILFSAAHATLVQKGMMVVLGAYFGVLVYLTGSLWASILAHAVNNFAVLTMTWIFGNKLPDVPVPWWMAVLSALVFGLAMTGLALERRPPAPAAD